METKVNVLRMERIRRACGYANSFDVQVDGTRGGLSLAWKQDVQGLQVHGSHGKGEDRTDDNLVEIINTKIHLNQEIDKDEVYWEQRARANWLKARDRNTTFFHKWATQRHKANVINSLQNNLGEHVYEEEWMATIAKNYFQDLFQSRGVRNPKLILEGVARCINNETNEKLTVEYSADEVKAALKPIGPTKAPRDDGFPAIFFQKCWHIVGTEDVILRIMWKKQTGLSSLMRMAITRGDIKGLKNPAYPTGKQSTSEYDLLAWEHSEEFTVRSAYKMLQNQIPTTYPIDLHTTTQPFYKQLWELQLPNKIKILAWKVSWNFIPTMVNLHQRRVVPTAICPRNKNLHKGMAHSGKENARYMRHYLGEIDGINERQISDAQQTDKWKAPAQPTININFDASFEDHNHQSVSAVVIRNHKGEIKATKSYLHSMVATAFEAEAIACYEAVLMGKDMGFSDILVEGDSKTIINKCMTKSRDKSHVSTYISNIHSEKSSFQNISFLFIPRSANQLAHAIATISLRKKEEIYLFDTAPGYATHQSELERPREPN
ncbi:hypothetical protein PVK06_002606 [Gossypium arboreum]|uniref:Reverse transcriptase n=1 Tax=Gossypium arboreum TaxID=29729 RepID=A0ABR0R5F7_GOSAR|nr:hypothetical protein PVK06_002606 [Gossypium arboreum]